MRSRLRDAPDEHRPVLFLDYDGTLAPFTDDRDRAVVYEGVLERLDAIVARTDTRLVIVSGRAARTVHRFLDGLGVEIFGCHGMERLEVSGELERMSLPEPVLRKLERARAALDAIDLGERIEVKPSSVAAHVRGLSARAATDVLRAVEGCWEPLALESDVEIHRFDGGIELRPTALDKGDAVRRVLAEEPPETFVAYLGDDATDEDAFEALEGRGLRVLVRGEVRPSHADGWIVPPVDLFAFLDAWVDRFARYHDSNDSYDMNRYGSVTIVSNRLPIVLRARPEGGWNIGPGSGGLVQAMTPILERCGGRWIGWPGVTTEASGSDALPLDQLDLPFELHGVQLGADEVEGYYRGFANSIVWPLFHNFPDRCDFDPAFWDVYLRVNEKFADAIAGVLGDDEPLWVHDYHLMHQAEMLRHRMRPGRIGFFLHIPFPSLENFVKVPWRADILRALLSYDLLGFQSSRDRRHFLDCVQRLMPEVAVNGDDGLARIEVGDRVVSVGTFPIGLDYDQWSSRASSPEVERRMRILRRELGPYKVLLGIDRLDYTKGLLERFLAFERALEHNPSLIENVVFFQLVVPSREKVPEYAALKREVDRVVGNINGRFSTTSWQPIRYLYNTVDPIELTALYRLADAAVVTPLCDGMNLVCKEYVASQSDEHGALILGEMAGAASQLAEHALLVNPYDIDGTADAIAHAIDMPVGERRARMRAMREIVDRTNVFRWADDYLETLLEPGGLERESAPEYLPHIEAPPLVADSELSK